MREFCAITCPIVPKPREIVPSWAATWFPPTARNVVVMMLLIELIENYFSVTVLSEDFLAFAQIDFDVV